MGKYQKGLGIGVSYKIVVDSCCELPEEFRGDSRFERVPLTLIVGDTYEREDDDTFDQAEFLKVVAECPVCAKSACPSPERYMEAYRTDADRVYVVTLSAKLSGSFNSAVLGASLYHETYGEKNIHVINSMSASCGEAQIVCKLVELEEQGLSFEEVTERIEEYTRGMKTYFVLDNLDTLRKNGRLTGVKALVASTLNIKPVMSADEGEIIQLGQAVGTKKALSKMVDTALHNATATAQKRLMISHCNALERALSVKALFEAKTTFRDIKIIDMAGLSSLYANDGGIIVTL